jgi:hypothetical protein
MYSFVAGLIFHALADQKVLPQCPCIGAHLCLTEIADNRIADSVVIKILQSE